MSLNLQYPSLKTVCLVYVLLGLLLWAVPLLNLLHVESSAVVAFVAFFAAGVSSLRLFAGGWSVSKVLAWQEVALLIPWSLLTVTLLWIPNCGYLQGLLFFGLFPVVTVVLAVVLAYAISGTQWRFKKAAFVAIGLGIALGTPLYDLGLHPQFYTYNHVFGGVLGPIYDEELVIRSGLFVFRGMTLLWAALAWIVGRWLRRAKGMKRGNEESTIRGKGGWENGGKGESERGRDGEKGRRRKGQALVLRLFDSLALRFIPPVNSPSPRFLVPSFYLVVLLLGGCYFFSGTLGINTPAWKIERTLGAVSRTVHFDIYYDADTLTPDDLRVLSEDHEYRYAHLAERLSMEVPQRIASYIYPDEETKARLTGARATNVAPVWLRRPQSHVLLDHYSRVFPHELVHVFSREFGVPVIKASAAVGLVEGLAVALEPPDGLPTPHEQVAVALQREDLDDAARLADDLAAGLSPLGFWSGRGAVSYTTMGSFVRFLLDSYGAERLKQVYAWADFEAVYGVPVETLAAEWQAYLRSLTEIDRSTADVVLRRFMVPSLLEKRCPHYVPTYRRRYRAGEAALAAGDTVQALAAFESSLREQPAYTNALAAWATLKLAENAPTEVIARLDTLDEQTRIAALDVRLGDAQAISGNPSQARSHYESALERLPAYAREQRVLVGLRIDLAEDAEIVRLLTSGRSPEQQANRLARFATAPPAVNMMRALRLAEADAFEQAAALLRSTPVAEPMEKSKAAEQQRLFWLAQTTYRARQPRLAHEYAQEAARAYQAAGEHNAAAEVQDFADKMRWVTDRE